MPAKGRSNYGYPDYLTAGIIGQATGKFEFQQDQMHAL